MQFKNFVTLLNLSKGLRTQKSFATDCGMTPQYMNRLLAGDTKPTISTLTKIAAHADNGVTLEALKQACGYSESDKEKPASTVLSAREAYDFPYVVLLAAAMVKPGTYGHIQEYVDSVVDMIYKLEKPYMPAPDTFDGECLGSKIYPGEEKVWRGKVYQEVDFTARTIRKITRIKAVVTWEEVWDGCDEDPTTFEHCVIVKPMLLTRVSDLKKWFPDAVDSGIARKLDDEDVYSETQYLLPDADNQEKTLLRTIFGEGNGEEVRVPALQKGYGFYVDEVPHDSVVKACENHKTYWPEGLKNPDDYKDDHREEYGAFALYAHILTEITGIDFFSFDNDYNIKEDPDTAQFKLNKSSIFVPEEWCDGNGRKYTRSTVLRECGRAAKELGVKFFGQVFYNFFIDTHTLPEYETEES